MRSLQRPALAPDLERYLDHLQRRVDSGADSAALWKKQRSRARMRRIAQILARITGPRERCMYCEDSRATDIEHYRPRSLFREHVFRWLNFLWICTACNRSKGNRFPCDETGNSLLIDPTRDDPWDFLLFDAETGEITPRWNPSTEKEDPRGLALLDTISPLRHQAVTEGRLRVYRRLRRAVASFLARAGEETVEELIQELLEQVEDAEDFGIAGWFFVRDGRLEEPFQSLSARFPELYGTIQSKL